MNGVADVLRRNSFLDRNRVGAAGASYGGYMINWILGHNNDPRFRFKVLVSHDGVYNLESMYGATEELWFPEWEFKGTPWTNPAMYSRWSPNKFVQNFNTPILIIHSELDYRVPLGEGMQLFTAVQRKGIDSKFLTFPDEGHWVLKPQNSCLCITPCSTGSTSICSRRVRKPRAPKASKNSPSAKDLLEPDRKSVV